MFTIHRPVFTSSLLGAVVEKGGRWLLVMCFHSFSSSSRRDEGRAEPWKMVTHPHQPLLSVCMSDEILREWVRVLERRRYDNPVY
jgi:hypothetical protein